MLHSADVGRLSTRHQNAQKGARRSTISPRQASELAAQAQPTEEDVRQGLDNALQHCIASPGAQLSAELEAHGDETFSMARVYADVNQNMPRAYWDYDSVNISEQPR
ncbi:uncharacterized protein SPSK_04646 [Sporothrix schenckii 1099-18]|uniref:Uncharacterized protein n=1 Tax=Sporothrix schenckii 1099-18 TaxID=1397361 RepID=A0A0F2M027_SPOSC|nr:uncharacterized protein SPSK_04646 [Sporothrix schenckii 1099-18]KJR83057.1 hypothetical protein SPSK_04646 [Sporothrix schenckii 1099-18]